MTVHQPQQPTPEELAQAEAQRRLDALNSLQENMSPEAQDLLSNLTGQLNNDALEAARLNPHRLDLQDSLYFDALEDQLFENYAEFPRAEISRGIAETLKPLLEALTGTTIPEATPIDQLLRMYVFHRAPANATARDYMRRMQFLREYLLQNLYCVQVQRGHEQEAITALEILHAERLARAGGAQNYAHANNVIRAVFTGAGLDLPFVLDKPVVIQQVSDEPVEVDVIDQNEQGRAERKKKKRPYAVSEYQLNDRAMDQLYIRQYIDLLANEHQTVSSHLGMSQEKLFGPFKYLPEDARNVSLPGTADADAKNAALGLSPEKLAYALELRTAAEALHQYMQDPNHGAARVAYIKNYLEMKQAKSLDASDAFSNVDTELGQDVRAILAGNDRYRHKALRTRLAQLKSKYVRLLNVREDFQSPLQDPLLKPVMDISAGIDVPHLAMQKRIAVIYQDNLQKLSKVLRGGKHDVLVQALEKLEKLDVDAANLPADFSLDDFEKVKTFVEEVAIDEQEVLDNLNESLKHLRMRGRLLTKHVRSEVLLGEFEVEVHDALAVYRDVCSRPAPTPPASKYLWSDGNKLKKLNIFLGEPWQTSDADTDELLQNLTLFAQEYVFLKDAYSTFSQDGLPLNLQTMQEFTSENLSWKHLPAKRSLHELEGAQADYDATAVPTGDWQLSAIRTRIDELIQDLESQAGNAANAAAQAGTPTTNPHQDKIAALKKLREQLTAGHFALEDINHFQSLTDPTLSFSADLAEHARRLARRGIIETAEARARFELDHQTPLSPEEIASIDHKNDQKTEEQLLEKRLENGPKEQLHDFLERLAGKTLRFHSVADAQKQLNDMYALAARVNNLPPIDHRLGKDVWYEMYAKVPVPDPTGKKGEMKEQEQTELLAISTVSTAGISFVGASERVSLEQFIYHIINTAAGEAKAVKMTWKHDNQKTPIRKLKDLDEAKAPVHSGNLEKGSLLQEGGKPLGKVLKHASIGKGADRQHGVILEVEKTADKNPKKKGGLRLFADKRNVRFMSFTEMYIKRDSLSAQSYDVDSVKGGADEGGHPRISLMTMFAVGKGIFTHKKEEIEKWGKMRKTLEALYFYKHDGKQVFNNASLWSKQQNEMESMENEIAKSYKAKLENLQSDQMEEKIREEMQRFKNININQVTSGNALTDMMGQEPIFVKRAEFKALLIFVLEHFGNLYPFESLANQRGDQFWLSKIKGSAAENERGYKFAIKNKGKSDGLAEVHQISGIARARINLYGDTFAQQVDAAYEKGKSVAKGKKEAELKLKQSGGQIREQLVQELKDRNWAGIEATFAKLVQKDVGSDVLFNMFLFLYIEITKYGDKHGLPPHIPYEELKDIAGSVFPSSPELYFFLLKGEPNVRNLERFLTQVDPNFYKYKLDENAEGTIQLLAPDGSKSKIHEAFTLDGNYQFLENYAEASKQGAESSLIDSNYITCLQKLNINPPALHLSDHDAKMWSRSPLLYTNEYVIENMITRHLSGSGLDNGHSRNYIESLVASLEKMEKNTPPHLRHDMEAFLNRMRRMIYDKVYVKFSFKDTMESGGSYSTQNEGIITDYPLEASQRRNGFMKAYYNKLKSVGLSVQECAKAAGQELTFVDNTDPEFKDRFKDKRADYLVWDVTNYKNGNNKNTVNNRRNQSQMQQDFYFDDFAA